MTVSERILIVANEGAQRRLILRSLDEHEFTIEVVRDCEVAYGRLLEAKVRLLIVDLAPKSDGLDLIKRVRGTPELVDTPVLVIGEWGTGQPALALSHGADAYEPAPPDERRLIDSVERVLHQQAFVLQ